MRTGRGAATVHGASRGNVREASSLLRAPDSEGPPRQDEASLLSYGSLVFIPADPTISCIRVEILRGPDGLAFDPDDEREMIRLIRELLK
jgi:hypothetical protein